MIKKKEGRPLPETADMKAWTEEYEQMSEEEHKAKLRELGLDDNEIQEALEVHSKEGEELTEEEAAELEAALEAEELEATLETEKKKKKK